MHSSPAPISAGRSGEQRDAGPSTAGPQESEKGVQDKVGRSKTTTSTSNSNSNSSSSSSSSGRSSMHSAKTSRAGGGSQEKSLAGNRTNPGSRGRSSSSSSSTGPGLGSMSAVADVIKSARSAVDLYKAACEKGKLLSSESKAAMASSLLVLLLQLGKLQTAGIHGACSSQCLCADYVSTMRQLVSACKKAVIAAGATDGNRSIVQDAIFRGLPAMAAQLLDAAAGHRLAAVQDALLVFRWHVVKPIVNNAYSTGTAAAAATGRHWATLVALVASKPGGLCDDLSKQLCSLCDQWKAARDNSKGAGQQGLQPDPTAQPVGPATQHLLAQLLLVFQWTAALCRIWPSSIVDAAPLHSLLSNTLDAVAELVTDFQQMQAATPALSAASDVHSADVNLTAATSPAAAKLSGSVTAAVLEVSALVLEPLGLLLDKLQVAHRQGMKLPSSSDPARHLCGQLQGGSTTLLRAMLAVCLDQLVLHAELKLRASGVGWLTQQPACMPQASIATHVQIAAPSRAAGSSSSSVRRSVAETAAGYLLQHADTLQGKGPALPSRAAVMAWRGVCERQWAAVFLPLTLQAAAAVLASTQPTAAAASPSGSVGSEGGTTAAVWAMQDCGLLAGHFGALGGGASSVSVNNPRGLDSGSSSGVGTASGVASSGRAPSASTRTSTSTSYCNIAGSAQGSSAAVGSEPILSIGSCIQQATALSAACQQAAFLDFNKISASSSSKCGLACTLLATAAAALSLQGAAALPLVSAALASATALVSGMCNLQASAQQPAVPAGAEQSSCDAGVAATTGSCVSSSSTEPQEATGATPATAGPAPVSDEWLCLSLAADLTTAVLYLPDSNFEQAGQHSPASSASMQCCTLLQVFLKHLCAQACSSDTATQLKQLQSVAYTLQLVEATVRRTAAACRAEPETDASAGPCKLGAEQEPHVHAPGSSARKTCCLAGFAAVRAALVIIYRVDSTLLGSLQGQQLLQSCTSLLLTCSSIQQSAGMAASPANLATCVMLLQLLQRAEPLAAAGGSSCGMSQSLAAGLSVVGRTLVAIGTALSPGDGAEGSILKQTMQDLLDCVQSIHQTLQQDAATPKAAASGASSSTIIMSDQASSSVQSRSHASSSGAGVYCADAVQGREQQLQLPAADWLLAGMDTAQEECDTLCSLVRNVPAPTSGSNTATYPNHITTLHMFLATIAGAELPAQCVAAGEALCAAVPCSACCSNPRCSSLDGVSAGFALVRGKACVCGGCLGLQAGGPATAPSQGSLVAARYCSRACQAAHRKQHKGLCERLAQAAAAAQDGAVASRHDGTHELIEIELSSADTATQEYINSILKKVSLS